MWFQSRVENLFNLCVEFYHETFRLPLCTGPRVHPYSQSYETQLCSGIKKKEVTRKVNTGSGAKTGEVQACGGLGMSDHRIW